MTNWLPRYKIHTDFCDLTEPESLLKLATKELSGGVFRDSGKPNDGID